MSWWLEFEVFSSEPQAVNWRQNLSYIWANTYVQLILSPVWGHTSIEESPQFCSAQLITDDFHRTGGGWMYRIQAFRVGRAAD
jgi:hypothetical protein